MAFKDRIKEARKRAGLSQKDLAERLNVSPQLVSFWEKGKNSPNERAIYGLMKELGVDANYLYQDEMAETSRDKITAEEMGFIYRLRELNEKEKNLVDGVINDLLDLQDNREKGSAVSNISYLQKPFGYARPSAGSGSFISDEMGEILVQDTPVARRADFVLQIDGKSMEPKLKDGDFVLVKKQDDVEDGEIGVWLVDENVYIKQRSSDGLHSLNPDYPDVELNENSSIYCYGKVIGKAEI